MADGVLTPAVSVTSAAAGLAVAKPSVAKDITGISLVGTVPPFLPTLLTEDLNRLFSSPFSSPNPLVREGWGSHSRPVSTPELHHTHHSYLGIQSHLSGYHYSASRAL